MSAKSVVTRISSEVVKTSWADNIATAVFSNPLAQMFNKKVYRKFIYYPHMGLYRDDCTKRNIYAPGVLDAAVQRLPESVQRERQYRISRAFLHSTGKTILDRKEWTMDDDVEYLDSALASVIRDIEIKRYWDQNGEQPPDDFKLTPEQYQATLSNMISQMQPAIQPK